MTANAVVMLATAIVLGCYVWLLRQDVRRADEVEAAERGRS
jgi:hypothetical protein